MGLIASSTVESAAGFANVVHTGRHELRADEPDHGGTDTGPSPYGLLLSALGACTSITLRMYAQRKNWELGTVHVALQLFKEQDGPNVTDRIEREVRISAALTDEQRAKLAEIVEKTPVTKTIKAGAPIHTRFA